MGNTLPKTNFNLQSADTQVGVSEQRMLLIGQKLSSGTATSETLIRDIQNDGSWETLFGAKSILANMIRQARKMCNFCQYQVAIDAIALDDAVNSVASIGKITFTGTATGSGEFTIVIGSEYNHSYTITVGKTTTATAIATELVSQITADEKAPFSASSSAGEVTLTFANKGTVGNDTTIGVNGVVAGITATITAFAGGTTDPTIGSGILNLISNVRYQEIAMPIEYGIDGIKTLLDGRFNANNRVLDGVLYVDKTDTLANHKIALNALNSRSLNYQCDKIVNDSDYKGSSIPEFSFIKATYNAVIKALRISDNAQLGSILIGQFPTDLLGGVHNNSLPFYNTSCPYLNAIDTNHHWTPSETNELNGAGGSVWDNNLADNALVMGEQFTTYKTDTAGNEDVTWKYLNYRDTSSAIREYRFKNFKKDFAQYRMNDNTEQEVRNAFIRYYRVLSGSDYRLLRSGKEALKYYAENLKVSLDYGLGTVTIICKDPIVTQVRQADAFFKVTFNLSTGEAV